MAISSLVQCEIRQGGNDTNGIGFVAGASGTDWTQQDNPQYTTTDIVANGTTTLTSATANWGADVVGNLISLSGGTGSLAQTWNQIMTRVNATTITVDAAIATGTGITHKIGGAAATPGCFHNAAGFLGAILAAITAAQSTMVWWKYNATVTLCSTGTSGPGGPFSLYINIAFRGYETVRGDNCPNGNRPTYKWTAAAPGSAVYMFGLAPYHSRNICMDCNNVANVNGISMSTAGIVISCVVLNASGTGCVGFNGGTPESCATSNCTTGFKGSVATDCSASGTSSQIGFDSCHCFYCKATGVGNGFYSGYQRLKNCLADGCSVGFNGNGYIQTVVNCIASNCTTYGYISGNSTFLNCFYYNCTAVVQYPYWGTLTQCTADPYVNRAGGDFRPNNNAGGGALLRGASIGPYGQINNTDIGPVQHADPAAGGATSVAY